MGYRKWGLAILTMFVLFLASCSGNSAKESSVSSDLSGEELFSQSCASCHGGDLKSGYAPDLDKIGATYSADDIQDIIENGQDAMPKGLLKGEDAEKVAEWLAEKE